MKIETEKFGEIIVDDNLVFTFVEPIIGYENLSKFVLIEHSENSAFKWLQSTENPKLAFPVSTPAYFDIDYQFEIPNEIAEKIELTTVESLISLNIVTIPVGQPRNSTMNLLAPIIINATNRQGMQLILSNTNYPVKQPLFND